MTSRPSVPGGTDTHDEEILADLFDALLQQILEGNTPDLASYHPDRPDLRDRIAKTWALACSVAGRREPSRPVLGGYEIVRELGHGGMGTVYLARHQALQRDVAIKVLPHSLAMSPRAKQRFLEEARALARLRHDHVVHIHRIIDHAEMLAFEMEYVDGPSLQQVVLELRRQAKPHAVESLAAVLQTGVAELGTRSTVEWFVRLGIRIARALGEVHRHGLVHRDVKPSNILLRKDGRPVLADFGLARDGDLPGGEAARGFAGTPVYAAPERLRGGDADIDARADVYSLGVTLYEALALAPPFGGSTTAEVLRRIENGRLPALRQQAPHVPRDLETVLGKAMEADPRHRYPTADAFADDLERLLNLQPILAQPAGPMRRFGKFLRRHQRVVGAALAGALLVTGVLWPAMVHAGALERARATASAETQAARSQVLSLESLHAVTSRVFAGASTQPLRQPSAVVVQSHSLAAARDHYRAAVLADPAQAGVRAEHDVLSVVLALRAAEEQGGVADLGSLLPNLPPLCRHLAEVAAAAGPRDDVRRSASGAAAGDRFATGLLAFLLGDLATSHACWNGLEQQLADHPLLDACQALQLACDGFPERAYPRLFHAARGFPGASALALAMADAALAMGDSSLAEQWLAGVPDDGREPIVASRRRLLQADLLAARRRTDEAASAYRDLARLDPTDPTPVQRLAALAAARGDDETTARLVRTLQQRWPDLPAAQLLVAQRALLRRDLPTYLREVRAAITRDLVQGGLGTTPPLAELLELGGLDGLLPGLPADAAPARSLAHPGGMPLAGWLPRPALAAVRAGLEFLPVIDHCQQIAHAAAGNEVAAALRAVWLAAFRMPGLLQQLPVRAQVVLLGGPLALAGPPADLLSQATMPFASALGTRMVFVTDSKVVQSPTVEGHEVAWGLHTAYARDVDGDSLPDVCIACPPTGRGLGDGYVELRSLADGSLQRRLLPDNEDLVYGRGLAVLGDIDGDHCDDVLVGAPRVLRPEVGTGEVELRSGRTGALLWRAAHEPIAFGSSLARLPDVDGDGRDDFLVGAPPLTLTGNERGRAFVCSGATGSVLRELPAPRGGTWFGAEVLALGDVDGDGVADVVVGGNYGGAPGLVVVFSGASGAPLLTFGDETLGADYGAALAAVDDVDGDGAPDLAVGAPGLSSRGKDRGKVQILGTRTGKVHLELLGERPGDGFGFSLCSVRDWVRQGGPSLCIGSRRGGPIGNGFVRVFSARNGAPQQTFACGPEVVRFGHSLANAGFLDRDAYPDVLVALQARSGTGSLLRMSFAQTISRNPTIPRKQ